jgi:hypothetical protein
MTFRGDWRNMMRRMKFAHLGVLAAVLWLAVAASVAVGGVGRQQTQQQNQQPCPAQNQQDGQQQQQPPQNGQNGQQNPNCNQQPAPLFGGSMSIKKSNQSTDSAALGFNGVDPNGQVQQAFLNAQPTPQSIAKAQAMAAYRPSAVDLAAFEQQGGLTQTAAPAAVGTQPATH